ncbi:MAG: carboxypeptidase-like regulatory domain-containing protein [Pirellulales bacterium]
MERRFDLHSSNSGAVIGRLIVVFRIRTKRMLYRIMALTTMILVGSVTGCGEGMCDLHAKVTLDGQPLEGASVTLVGTGKEARRTAVGISDAEGLVQFTTFQPGDGVAPGEYKVVISKTPKSAAEEFANVDPNNPEDLIRMEMRGRTANLPYTPSALPRVYLSAETTPLSCTVPPTEEPVVFNLESSLGRRAAR